MKSVEQFIEILSEQLKLNEELLDISLEKKSVIMDNDTKTLNVMAHKEQEVVKRIISLEKLRGAVVANIERELGIEHIDNIADIVNNIENEQGHLIKEIGNQLRTVLDRLQEANELNNKLLEISIDYIEFSVNVLTSTPEPKTYGKKAFEQNSGKTNFFDAKY